jgi:hypothetical protein
LQTGPAEAAAELAMRERDAVAAGEALRNAEADVVTRERVARPGIPEPYEQLRD